MGNCAPLGGYHSPISRKSSMDQARPTGWVKPQPKRTLQEIRAQIAEKRAELEVLEKEAFNLEQGPRLEAIAECRNIMRAHQLTLADLGIRTPKRTR
jgi:hypothetical protein